LLCGASLTARADDTVTFQVDLTRYTNSAGQQAATLVDVRGAFNSWSGGSTLVNNGANVYTNTFAVTGTAGTTFQYKFTYTTPVGVTWEDDNPPPGAGQPADQGNNRVLLLVGGAQTLPVVPFYAPSVTPPIDLPTNNITYRVDLTEQVQLGDFLPGDTITVTGEPLALSNWGAGVGMTNDPALSGNASNIYSAVVGIQGVPGAAGGDFKFRMNSGWEETAIGDNRNFKIIGGDQVLPVYFYFDQPIGPPTNANVKFQVDMTPQVISGGFTNGMSAVRISGYFNGWPNTADGGELMTNNPALSGNASNVYSAWISIDNLPGTVPTTTVGLVNRYKFRADGGWEAAAIYGVGGNKDRQLIIAGGDQILPLVTYNDASLCDILQQKTTVTFVLHLPNGTLDDNGIPFDKANDHVYINGDFLNWPQWLPANLPEMTNNPVGSDFYTVALPINGGNPRRLQFKFGIDGPNHSTPYIDNENPQFTDHVKYVRSNSNPYTLATAEFGSTHLSVLVEPVIGDLRIGAPSGGNLPITWLGCPCATLQTRTTLNTGSWTDLPVTDGLSATNWPNNTGTARYFRVQRRQFP
jgi:hypothetical protein